MKRGGHDTRIVSTPRGRQLLEVQQFFFSG
jgi:hypothetical protein